MQKKNKKPSLNLVTKAFLMIFILIISQISFSVMLAPEVKAEIVPGCCEKTSDGAFCQNVFDVSKCGEGLSSPTSCENTNYCKLGCCYSSTDGVCDEQVPKKQCEEEGRSWEDAPNCQIAQCSEGCCIIGKDGFIITETKCKALSSKNRVETNFRTEITDELSCANEAMAQDKGCCKLPNACKFGTRQECSGLGGEFHNDVLCAADKLNCPCTAHAKKGCIENRDEVFWFDSCGNPENIFDSAMDKNANYKSNVVSKEKSCGYNAEKGNVNSESCGNCDYAAGTSCGKNGTKYVCKDLNCYDTYVSPNSGGGGGTQNQGESWCVYDSKRLENDRSDPVGSQHWRHVCLYGEEIVQPCNSYRTEICLNTSVGDFSYSACVPNRYSECLNATSKAECESEDSGLKTFCFWGDYAFGGKCNPKYAPGLSDATKGACATASVTCETKWLKEWGAREELGKTLEYDWKTDKNSRQCFDSSGNFKSQWIVDANKYCYSIGDCGAYMNIVGELTSNYAIHEPSPPSGVYWKVIGNKSLSNSAITALKGTLGLTKDIVKVSPAAPKKPFSFITGKTITGAENALPSPPKNVRQAPVVEIIGGQSNLIDIAGGTKTMAQTISKLPQAQQERLLRIFELEKIEAGKFAVERRSYADITTQVDKELAAKGTEATGKSALGNFWEAWHSVIITLVATALAYVVAKQWSGASEKEAASFAAGVSSSLGVYYILRETVKWPWLKTVTAGWGALYVVVAVLIIATVVMLLVGDEAYSTVAFECKAWTPPLGGKDCELCNHDKMKPCNEYRCKSLGAACELVNKGTGNEACIWKNKNDVLPPIIVNVSAKTTTKDYYVSSTKLPPATSFKIQNTSSGGCLDAYENFAFTITTNETAQCKIDLNRTLKFEQMKWDIQDNSFKYDHTQNSYYAIAGMTVTQGPSFMPGENYNLYIRCRDVNGNTNEAPYVASFCTEKGPDLTPPRYVDTSIKNGAYVAYGLNNISLSLYINEDAGCRWDTIDRGYKDMINNFGTCSAAMLGADRTFRCGTNLAAYRTGTNTYYFRCNDTSGNINSQSYKFEFTRSTSILGIASAKPSGNVYGNFDLVPVTLEVTTKDGAESGKAVCSYNVKDFSSGYIQFVSTNAETHSQKIFLPNKAWQIAIKCVDSAGNLANTTLGITTSIDKTYPKMTRVYQENNLLKLVTDEISVCAFSTKSCSFNFADGTEMTGTDKDHVTDWITDIIMYVQCKDSFGNSKCIATIKPYESNFTA